MATTLEGLNREEVGLLGKYDMIEGYQQILKAMNAVSTLQDALRQVRAHDIDMPTNADEYASKIFRWLFQTRLSLEQELGLDQYRE